MRQLPYESGIDALVALSVHDKIERERISAENRVNKLLGISMEDVMRDVCAVFQIDYQLAVSSSRKENVILCRRLFFYIGFYCLRETKKTLGRFFNTDHSTPFHHIAAVVGFMKVRDEVFLTHWKFYMHNSKLFTEKDLENLPYPKTLKRSMYRSIPASNAEVLRPERAKAVYNNTNWEDKKTELIGY